MSYEWIGEIGEQMSIKDLIKGSVLEEFANNSLSMREVILLLLIAAILGIYIFFIYRMVTLRTFYSKTFNVSLILLCILTAAIILTIQSSVVVSLGMVGALSIVRFRTAIKEPLDLVFLFWAISIGIITGAGLPTLAVVVSGIVTIVTILFMYMPEQRKSMLLNINGQGNIEHGDILQVLKKYDKRCLVKSTTVTNDSLTMLAEVHLQDCDTLIKELRSIKGIYAISLITNRGESN